VVEEKKSHIEPIRRRDLESPFSVGKHLERLPQIGDDKTARKYFEKIDKNMAVPSEPFSLTHTKELLFENDNC